MPAEPAHITQIKGACNNIAVELMKIHPAVSSLGQKEAEKQIYEALYRLTQDLEAIKKIIGRLQRTEGGEQ